MGDAGPRRGQARRRGFSRATSPAARLRAELLAIDGGSIISCEDQAAGEPSYHAAIALYRELGDARGEAKVLTRLAVHAGTRGERDEARKRLERVRALTEGLDLPVVEAQRLGTLAMLAQADGDLERAVSLYADSADVAAACGFTLWETWSRTDLGRGRARTGAVRCRRVRGANRAGEGLGAR